MVVYVEYVVAENFIIDFFLLKTAFYLSGAKPSKITTVIAALLGGGFALFLSFFDLPQVFLVIVKIAFGCSMVLISGRFSRVKEYYATAVGFFLLSFAVGGVITGVYSVFGVSAEKFTALTVIPVCGLCALSKCLFRYFRDRVKTAGHTVKIKITVGTVTVEGRGFFDTGNGVFYKDSPVIICGEKFFKGFFKSGFKMPAVFKVGFSTVSGKDDMRALKTDCVSIYFSDEPNIYYNVTLGIVKTSVGIGYDVILHPALMGVDNENRAYLQNKKVS